jgi:putative ABC transport system permease protein
VQFWEGVTLALTQIRSEKLKSFFTLLGVIIGVMFLIVVVSVVEGLDRYIREDFASEVYGINTVVVRQSPTVRINPSDEDRRAWARRPRLTYDDAEALAARVTSAAAVGIESGGQGEVQGPTGLKVENVRVTGTTANIFAIRDWELERGRSFSEQEVQRGVPVVVLGKSTADAIFEDLDPIGKRVKIRGFPYRVIGVLEEQGSILGRSLDNRAIAPVRSPVQNFTAPRGRVDQIVIQAPSPDLVGTVRGEAEGVLRSLRGLRPAQENDFELETSEESLGFWDRISRILFLALPGLVAISLVVGGIVIMNIMLVSVMERTREIGVRKALGARRKDILTQVLIESATLSFVGAALGVAVGVLLAMLVRAASPLPASVAFHWVALGVSLGVIVGVVAGVYPASRASRLDPVDALRYE